MSAILSADDLNDFISPGVACIKPIETLPKQQPPQEVINEYEVTTEERVAAAQPPPPAQISLTDCLACSGCVTSAEAVLVSLQSHGEVLETLDRYESFDVSVAHTSQDSLVPSEEQRIFVASISPQVRASLAATYGVSERQAGYMIAQLLQGPHGLRTGGKRGSSFSYLIDISAVRDLCLYASVEEVCASRDDQKGPILTSACPGWICYAEKTHPHVLPHLSSLKSPQAVAGTLVKSILAKQCSIPPDKVWHLAIMPCFDKKLEGARAELTSHSWHGQDGGAVRDVDCVITARELLMLAESRGISFPCLPRAPLNKHFSPVFPNTAVTDYLTQHHDRSYSLASGTTIGTSGGFLNHIMHAKQASHPGSSIHVQPGRNPDVAEHVLVDEQGMERFRAARYYGFRNIQNLVRRLKPAKQSRVPGANPGRRAGGSRKPSGEKDADYGYVEVMACPGGCTNGGGQIKVGDVLTLRQAGGTGIVNGGSQDMLPAQRDWLAKVDEAYWSASDSEGESPIDGGCWHETAMLGINGAAKEDHVIVDGVDHTAAKAFLQYWSEYTGIQVIKLIHTTYRAVESDVGKTSGQNANVERVAGLAVQLGGGW